MPIPTASSTGYSTDPDTYSLSSLATNALSIDDCIPAQLVRSAKKGFLFNVMTVGNVGIGKTDLLSAMFDKNLEIFKESKRSMLLEDMQDVKVAMHSKTFEIDGRKTRLKLTVVEAENYAVALNQQKTHLPIIEYIDQQFAEYHKRESSSDRRNIQDKRIHCLFFFISANDHGFSKLDLEFLRAAHTRTNIIPIVAMSEVLTPSEKAAFKSRVRDDFEKHGISVYRMPDPDPEESDEVKRVIKEMQETVPFAVPSLCLNRDGSLSPLELDYGSIDPFNKDHSDFLLLKTMVLNHMTDLCESTHEVFYEDYRLRKLHNK